MSLALLLTALFNGAWQGAVLCTLAVLTFRMFRRLNATTMFTVWSVLLAITVVLPFANYGFAPKPYTVRISEARVTPHYTPARSAKRASIPPASRLAKSPIVSDIQRPSLSESVTAFANVVFENAATIVLVLALIALLRLAVLARDVIRMLVARQRVRPIETPVTLSSEISRPFNFGTSDEFTSPCVLGFSPALIVIPEELLGESSSKLISIVLHEREHVRRFDDIQNVIQRFIGAIMFFCPGVRIALRELALYREQICDDAAVNGTGDRVSYAMTLTAMSQWAQGRGTPVPSLIFKRKQLLHRLEVLLDSAVSHSLRMNRRFAITAAATLALAAWLVLRIQMPVIAQSIIAPPPPPPVPPRVHVALAPKVRATPAPLKTQLHLNPMVRPNPDPHPNPRRHPNPHVASALKVSGAVIAFVAKNRYEADARQRAVSAEIAAATPVKHSSDLLDALNAAGLHDLSVDELIAIRDHGVSPELVRAATSYFGHISARDLTYLADHGVGQKYIETLRLSGITGIEPASAVELMDHGVSGPLIHAATQYFSPRPSASDLANLSDHGVTGLFIDSLRSSGLGSVSIGDAIRLMDHGITGPYVLKIRRMNPRASIDDIIRFREAGF